MTPKRFAQGIGATLSVSALVLNFAFGETDAAYVLVAMVAIAATLESVFAYCLGCKVFAILTRIGVIPESVCRGCADIWARPSWNQTPRVSRRAAPGGRRHATLGTPR